MALPGTHIRFAIDEQSKYQVHNLNEYILGTVYPDSRYLSGIDRDKTHNDNFLKPPFVKNDFYAGWQVHLWVDKIQGDIMKELFPEKLKYFVENGRFIDNEEWEFFSALKVAQDLDDIKKFDLQKHIDIIKEGKAVNPNKENIEAVVRANQVIVDLYNGKKKITVSNAGKMWLDLGVEKEKVLKIEKFARQILENGTWLGKVSEIYPEMKRRFDLINKV
jgi:hypothetical protein